MPTPISNVAPTSLPIGDNFLQKAVSGIGGLIGFPGFGGAASAANQATNTQNALNTRLSQGNVQPGLANQSIGSVFNKQPPTGGVSGLVPPPTNTGQNPGNAAALAQLEQMKQTLLGLQNQVVGQGGTPIATPPNNGTMSTPTNNAQSGGAIVSPTASASTTGQPAPPGMEYGPTGQLQPISNDTTVNAQGSNTPISTNVATGGGTQTNYPSIVGALASTAAASSPEFKSALAQYDTANQALAKLRDQYANQTNNIATTPGDLSLATGEQGALYNRFSGQEQALTGEMTAALQAAQTVTGEQGTQQAGLAAAGGLAQPQGANVLGTYNPLTGQYSGYGGAANGAAGAFQGGQVQGNFNAGQQYQQVIAPSYNAAQGVLTKLNGFLNSNPDINPSNFNLANQLKAWAMGQNYSDPKYPEMSQYIGEFLNTLTPLIGAPGENTNYKQQVVDSFVNGTSGTGSLQDQLNNLFNNIATTKYESIYGTGQSIASPSNTSANGTPNTTTSGYTGWGATK